MNLNQLLALQTPRWETSRPVFQRIHQPKLSYLSQARKVDYGPVRVAAEGEPLRLARSAPVLTWLERVALWIALLVAAASGIGLACGAGYVKGARVERKAAAQLRFAEEQHVAARAIKANFRKWSVGATHRKSVEGRTMVDRILPD